jgi:TetR/AcrR family transcriptional repressor of nem operon
MPYSPEHKARTRERIVESARRLFNRHGFERVSIDQIMADAKLTRGGFYNHFASKGELYAAAIERVATCTPFAKRVREAKPPMGARPIARLLIEMYLSDEVLNDLDKHCPLYAVSSDVARSGKAPQNAYTELLRRMLEVHRAALAGERDAERRAETIVSLCVGGMTLARTIHDPALRKSLRAASRKHALALLDGPKARKRRAP